MTRPEDDMLEDLFDAARKAPPAMPDGLMDRIEAEGRARQPQGRADHWRGWLAGIGGLAGLGGLVTATLAGVWIGVAGPAPLTDPVESFLGVDVAEEDGWLGSDGFGWDSDEGAAG